MKKTFGTSDACDIVLQDKDNQVRPEHGVLSVIGNQAYIEKLDAQGVILVNGKRIFSRMPLVHNAKVVLGKNLPFDWQKYLSEPIAIEANTSKGEVECLPASHADNAKRYITIGRMNDNNVVIPTDTKVSRHHGKFYEINGSYYIVDTNSKNGIYVDGKKITGAIPIVPSSKIEIGNQTFSGDDLMQHLNALHSHPASPEPQEPEKPEISIEDKYQQLQERYIRLVQQMTSTLRVDKSPYAKVFPTDDAKVCYFVDEYTRHANDALAVLHSMARTAREEAFVYRDDMELLSRKCQESAGAKRRELFDLRLRISDLVTDLQNTVANRIEEAIAIFEEHYRTIFAAYYETSVPTEHIWEKLNNEHNSAMPCLLYGIQTLDIAFFERRISFTYWQFARFLKEQNLLVSYSNKTASTAESVVNNLLGRVLAGSRSGNVKVHMADIKELGGTSNILKLLDRHVYTINGRAADLVAELSQLDRYVEDVVQNLLYGPYQSLAQYNQGKEKQEPYHIVVLKDFPYGITQEIAHIIQRILINGGKAGVHFIFMFNEDNLQGSEECIKIANILRISNARDSLNAQVIELHEDNQPDLIRQSYCKLDDNLLHEVVQYVNAGFEMKKDEILRLTDYMIPKEEWWTKHSASRADIPFGMSTNKQIQKLNITQESGQNSAIVIGIPGSGKSVFLHVLIANAMVNYSPRELQMYLLDFSGVEFDVYARHKLPHARVIAPEAEREFGLSILREVFEEGNRRMSLCRENGVTNIVELKQKNPELIVPRLLVIIDEFQKIFEIENDKISQEANAKIHAIIQEYRKFGINLILATQKLPAKSVVPFDLIANRVVFKADPNDFNNLIKWSHSTPQPRLLTGNCVYNNESGAEVSNYLTRSFFINASGELEKLIDEVATYAQAHPEMTDEHELRTFRSDELPEFTERVLSDRHIEHQDAPREVGVYMGESIAIAPCHVYVPLTKDSNNNILIIGGKPDVAKGIAYHTLLSEVAGHNEKTCNVILMNFMMEDDPMRNLFDSEMFSVISDFCNLEEAKAEDEIKEFLQFVKDEVIDARKNDATLPLAHFFINIFEFQRGRMFDGTGSRGDMQSDCARLLEYIIKNGPMVGVFTVLQVDNLANLNRLGYGAQNMFCHRIALQMSEQDSDKIVGNQAANRLLVLNRPATNFRGLYYNNINNSITKFKPYRYDINSNQQ